MIRVMVVEDEPPIMRMLVQLIEAYEGDFQVVATAYNGQRAIETLEKESIDVVFTDIRMPVKGGLALAEHIFTHKLEIPTIIISGYQDFEYARQAINFQVRDYLVKPVQQSALYKVLQTLEENIHQQQTATKKEEILKSMQSTPTEKVVTTDKRYGALLLLAGPFPMAVQEGMLPGEVFWNSIDVVEQVTPLLEDQESCLIFRGTTSVERVIILEVDSQERVDELGVEIHVLLQGLCSVPITLVGQTERIAVEEVGDTLKVLRKHLYTQTKLFTPTICWKEELRPEGVKTKRNIKETIQSVLESNSAQIEKCITVALRQLIDSGYTQLQLVDFMQRVVAERVADTVQKDLTKLKIDMEVAAANAVDVEGLAKEMSFLVKQYGSATAKVQDVRMGDQIAQEIELYLQNNYQLAITTNALAKKFGFVPSYISKLFKAYKGMSPSEYLSYYRIEKSKQIMNENPNLLCKEVAELVGYQDQHYFSKIFKKQTGMWPTAYSNQRKTL